MSDNTLKKIQTVCIALSIFFLFMASKSCVGQNKLPRVTFEWDDTAEHYWAGFTIAAITTDAVFKHTKDYGKAFLAGFLMANLAGAGKELVWDGYLNRGVKSWEDYGFTGYGGLCGAGVSDIWHHYKETKEAERVYNSKHILD